MWIGLLLFLTHLAPEAIDINPIVFTLSGIVIAWGMMFYRIFDLVPIALENIYQSIHDGVIILDNDKRIVGCNPIAVKVLGDYAKNPVGKMLKELTEFSKLVRPLFESEKGEFNMALEGKESIRHYHTRTSIIYNRNGLMIGRAIIFTDITRIIENENLLRDNELKLRELNATKDKLFSIIAHDLKNPFQVLLGFSELIQDEAEMINNELIKKYSNQLIQSTVQTHKLLQNLLDWSVAQSGGINFNPVTIKLKQIVDEVTDTIRPSALAKKISVEINVPPEYQIFADNKMIQTVIRNLIANAVKFSFANKTISISALRTEGYIELTVEDSGVGMNPEKVNDLFKIDKMSSSAGTSGESGTGLGLILCKEFIEKNNGSISARSTEGKGSAFIIRLPEANLR
jgi:signal transduction histidine kinase